MLAILFSILLSTPPQIAKLQQILEPLIEETNTPHTKERSQKFAAYFYYISQELQLDPILLIAIAKTESDLNPNRTGSIGELGIMQLHPRSAFPAARNALFMRNPRYRKRCLRTPSACQDEVIQAGATILQYAIKKCKTNFKALQMYNSGTCTGNPSYARKVQRTFRRIKKSYDKL